MAGSTSEDLCHEVRNPLTSIANSANLLLYRMELPEERAGATKEEMRELVTTILLEVGRAERGVLAAALAIAHDPRLEVFVAFGPDALIRVDGG